MAEVITGLVQGYELTVTTDPEAARKLIAQVPSESNFIYVTNAGEEGTVLPSEVSELRGEKSTGYTTTIAWKPRRGLEGAREMGFDGFIGYDGLQPRDLLAALSRAPQDHSGVAEWIESIGRRVVPNVAPVRLGDKPAG